MKRIHPIFPAALLVALIFMSVKIMASGWYTDPDRLGEGMTLIEGKNDTAFALYTYWDAKHAVPPKPIPLPDVILPCGNCVAWYLGTKGVLYMSAAYDYPEILDGYIAEEFRVGTYKLTPLGDGYQLSVQCDPVIPDLWLCKNTFEFTHKILGD